MKKLYAGLIGLTAASALALSANAADMYAPGGYKDYVPAAVWAGFYAGANVGYGWGTSGQLACDANCSGNTAIGPFGGVSPAGWLGGVQLGYNFQGAGSPLVFGVETDIQASTILGQGRTQPAAPTSRGLQALGTVRGRAGYAMDRALVYVTGGLAYGSVDNEAGIGGTATYANNPNTIATGYVLGGGVEYKVKRDLSLKVEYQYVNLGKNDLVDGNSTSYSASAWRYGARRCVQHRARRPELFPVCRARAS